MKTDDKIAPCQMCGRPAKRINGLWLPSWLVYRAWTDHHRIGPSGLNIARKLQRMALDAGALIAAVREERMEDEYPAYDVVVVENIDIGHDGSTPEASYSCLLR